MRLQAHHIRTRTAPSWSHILHTPACVPRCHGLIRTHHDTQLRRIKVLATQEQAPDGEPNDRAGAQEAKNPPSSVEEASTAVQAFFSALGQPDGIQQFMDWVPDSALDSLIDSRKRSGVTGGAPGFSIDSFASRLLLWDCPRTVTPLSAISLEPEKSVHRLHVTSACGEEVTLTVVAEKQDTLQPQYRSSPRIERTWRLCSLAGEALEDAGEVAAPSPAIGPELVVAAQMAALRRRDTQRVFAFASPENQAVTGPLERFEEMLQGAQFRPLLGHSQSDSLRRIMHSQHAYMELVVVTLSVPGQQVSHRQHWLYVWNVQRQPADRGTGQPGAWCTQSVQLVGATNSAT